MHLMNVAQKALGNTQFIISPTSHNKSTELPLRILKLKAVIQLTAEQKSKLTSRSSTLSTSVQTLLCLHHPKDPSATI